MLQPFDGIDFSNATRRVPIAALLRQDTANVVDRFSEQGRTYYRFKNDMYLFPADDVRGIMCLLPGNLLLIPRSQGRI